MKEALTSEQRGKWHLEGYDTFDRTFFPLDGEYKSETDAIQAARERLNELERTQPSVSSGGQHGGIQDRVFIISPTGARRRFI